MYDTMQVKVAFILRLIHISAEGSVEVGLCLIAVPIREVIQERSAVAGEREGTLDRFTLRINRPDHRGHNKELTVITAYVISWVLSGLETQSMGICEGKGRGW